MSREYVPNRGDIVWLQFNPNAGHEQEGRRPAIVLSPQIYNKKVGLALFCPITSRKKGYPFEVSLPENQIVSGVVLSDQIKSLDWRKRKAERISRAPSQLTRDVIAKVNTLLREE